MTWLNVLGSISILLACMPFVWLGYVMATMKPSQIDLVMEQLDQETMQLDQETMQLDQPVSDWNNQSRAA